MAVTNIKDNMACNKMLRVKRISWITRGLNCLVTQGSGGHGWDSPLFNLKPRGTAIFTFISNLNSFYTLVVLECVYTSNLDYSKCVTVLLPSIKGRYTLFNSFSNSQGYHTLKNGHGTNIIHMRTKGLQRLQTSELTHSIDKALLLFMHSYYI